MIDSSFYNLMYRFSLRYCPLIIDHITRLTVVHGFMWMHMISCSRCTRLLIRWFRSQTSTSPFTLKLLNRSCLALMLLICLALQPRDQSCTFVLLVYEESPAHSLSLGLEDLTSLLWRPLLLDSCMDTQDGRVLPSSRHLYFYEHLAICWLWRQRPVKKHFPLNLHNKMNLCQKKNCSAGGGKTSLTVWSLHINYFYFF